MIPFKLTSDEYVSVRHHIIGDRSDRPASLTLRISVLNRSFLLDPFSGHRVGTITADPLALQRLRSRAKIAKGHLMDKSGPPWHRTGSTNLRWDATCGNAANTSVTHPMLKMHSWHFGNLNRDHSQVGDHRRGVIIGRSPPEWVRRRSQSDYPFSRRGAGGLRDCLRSSQVIW